MQRRHDGKTSSQVFSRRRDLRQGYCFWARGRRRATTTDAKKVLMPGRQAVDNGVGQSAKCASTSHKIQLGVLGQPCTTGSYACVGHAQRQQLACAGGTWTANGTCAAGQSCNTAPGAKAGTCEPIVAQCAGKRANDPLCQGLDRLACGADLVSTTMETCAGGCVSGACTACHPAAKQCLGDGVQTCDASGAWVAAVVRPARLFAPARRVRDSAQLRRFGGYVWGQPERQLLRQRCGNGRHV